MAVGDSLAVSSMFNTKSAVDSLTVIGCCLTAAALRSLARWSIRLRAPLLVGEVATNPVVITSLFCNKIFNLCRVS